VAELVPALVVGQLGGVLVDPWDRRRILIAASLLQALLLLPLLAVDSVDRLWIVYLVAAAQSGLARVCSPATAALIPALVPRDELAAANAMNAVGSSVARLVGAPLGGLAVQLLGLGGIVAVDAATFLAAALFVVAILVPAAAVGEAGATVPDEDAPPAPVGRPNLVADWIDGLRTIIRTPRLGPAIAIGAASQVAQGIFVVLFVVFVLDVLRADGAAVGLIRGVQAIGGIAAGIGIGMLHGRVSNRALVGVGFIAFGLISLLTWNLSAVTDAVPVYVVLFMIVGVPAVATFVGLQSMIQTITPPSHLGRVFAAFETGAGALQAVGVVVAGALADQLGVLPILNVQASIYVVCGIAALVFLRERDAGRTVRAA
jgi:predicted MFS family arabinose efflux permease